MFVEGRVVLSAPKLLPVIHAQTISLRDQGQSLPQDLFGGLCSWRVHTRQSLAGSHLSLGGGAAQSGLLKPGGILTYLAERGCAALMGCFFTRNP